MPTVSRFFGIVIAMYYDDHGPPRFHARHAGAQAKVWIDTLLENWQRAREGETLLEIDPLK